MCAMVCVSFIFVSLTSLFEGASKACGMLPHCRFCCVRAGASRVVVVHISNASVFGGVRAYVYCHRQRCFPDLGNEAEACMHETGEAQRGAYAQHTYHIERESERWAQVCVRMTWKPSKFRTTTDKTGIAVALMAGVVVIVVVAFIWVVDVDDKCVHILYIYRTFTHWRNIRIVASFIHKIRGIGLYSYMGT